MNIENEDILEKLVDRLSRLPSIGRKSAQRLAFFLLGEKKERVLELSQVLVDAVEKISECENCHNYAEAPLCKICSQPHRQENLICLVEKPVDIMLVERFGFFRGLYHVLGGNISPLDGVGPEDLNFSALKKRLEKLDNPEIILALSTNSDGEATTMYLLKWLEGMNVKVSRLARGIPLGSDLQYVDEMTMQKALESRVPL